MGKNKVSVIIPIYGVENFVKRCAESLLTQSLQDIELIFVDDDTKDLSVSVIESCIKKHPSFKGDVKIIHHEKNKGLPAARNTGLSCASGDYVFHCDGDDWLEVDALEKLYSVAVESDADYVWCDWFLSYDNSERVMAQPDYSSKDDMLRNGLLGCGMKYNVWNKLVRRSVYLGNNITFPEGRSMGEDMTMIMLASCSTKVAHCPYPLYHYVRMNTGALTQSLNEKKLDDIVYNVERVSSFLESKFSRKYSREINWFKINVKLPLLIECDGMYDKWLSLFPESNTDCLSNSNVSMRTRVIEYLAMQKCWTLVSVYRKLFNLINKLMFER